MVKATNMVGLVRSRRFLMSCLLSATVLIMVNQIWLGSSYVGVGASFVYILIGGYFVGVVLFKDEQLVVKASLGVFFLLCFMSVLSWIFLIFNFSIGIFESGVVLLATLFFIILVVFGKRFSPKRFVSRSKSHNAA